jgi:hypothetical protein
MHRPLIPCKFAGCNKEAHYTAYLKRPCGHRHPNIAPQPVCSDHSHMLVKAKRSGGAPNASVCPVCGQINRVDLDSLSLPMPAADLPA